MHARIRIYKVRQACRILAEDQDLCTWESRLAHVSHQQLCCRVATISFTRPIRNNSYFSAAGAECLGAKIDPHAQLLRGCEVAIEGIRFFLQPLSQERRMLCAGLVVDPEEIEGSYAALLLCVDLLSGVHGPVMEDVARENLVLGKDHHFVVLGRGMIGRTWWSARNISVSRPFDDRVVRVKAFLAAYFVVREG